MILTSKTSLGSPFRCFMVLDRREFWWFWIRQCGRAKCWWWLLLLQEENDGSCFLVLSTETRAWCISDRALLGVQFYRDLLKSTSDLFLQKHWKWNQNWNRGQKICFFISNTWRLHIPDILEMSFSKRAGVVLWRGVYKRIIVPDEKMNESTCNMNAKRSMSI